MNAHNPAQKSPLKRLMAALSPKNQQAVGAFLSALKPPDRDDAFIAGVANAVRLKRNPHAPATPQFRDAWNQLQDAERGVAMDVSKALFGASGLEEDIAKAGCWPLLAPFGLAPIVAAAAEAAPWEPPRTAEVETAWAPPQGVEAANPEPVAITICRAATPETGFGKFWGPDKPVAAPMPLHVTLETHECANIEDLCDLVVEIERDPLKCIIRGAPLPGIDCAQPQRRLSRAQGDAAATIEDRPTAFFMLDIDDPLLIGARHPADRGAIEAAIAERLRGTPFENVDYVVQLSGSTGHPARDGVKVHLFFLLSRSLNSPEAKVFTASSLPEDAYDPAVFKPPQPHFTATPLTAGITDPYAGRRTWLVKGAVRRVPVSDVIETQKPKSEPRQPRSVDARPGDADALHAIVMRTGILASGKRRRTLWLAYRRILRELGASEDAAAEMWLETCDSKDAEGSLGEAKAWAEGARPDNAIGVGSLIQHLRAEALAPEETAFLDRLTGRSVDWAAEAAKAGVKFEQTAPEETGAADGPKRPGRANGFATKERGSPADRIGNWYAARLKQADDGKNSRQTMLGAVK